MNIKILLLYFIFSVSINNISAQDPHEKAVRFIVFGDSQFANPSEFERMIYEAELLAPDFVIQVGDLIQGYTHDRDKLRSEWRRFKNQISLLTAEYYPVPGNHDIVTAEAEEIYSEVWGKEKLLYSFDYGNVHCIVLNSWNGNEDDRITEWQRVWLREDLLNLVDAEKKSIFVFLHSPLWKYPETHEGRKDWELVHKILKDYNVKLVAGGHTHEYVWENRDGIDYLVINSAGVSRINERVGEFSSFLNITVQPSGDVKYAVIKAGSILPLDTVTPEERSFANRYKIKERTIQISDWKENEELSTVITVPIENSLIEDQLFYLDWKIPFGADLQIDPKSLWLTIPSKQKSEVKFDFKSKSAPSPNLMPQLNVSSEKNFRSGFVSRDLEEKLQQRNIDETSSIALETKVNFTGVFRLYIPPIARVNRLKGEIKIDGKIDEAAWSDAGMIDEIGTHDSVNAEVKTSLKFLYDKNHLYISAWMEEPDINNFTATAGGEIPLTWNDDDIEFFFDTEKSQSDYIRLFQNAAGTRFNSLQRWVENKYFKSKYVSDIFIGENFWSIEMQIPWRDIGVTESPQQGSEWSFNIGRHRPKAKVKELTWAGGLYNPQKYGILRFE